MSEHRGILFPDMAIMPDKFSPPPDALLLWVVYFNPDDFPGRYVVRQQYPDPSSGEAIVSPLAHSGDTLEQVRAHIPKGLHCMPRHPKDDPVIIESWF